MFFILSKIIGLFLNPLVWVSGLLIWALVTSKKGLRKWLNITALLLLLFFSNSFIFNETIRWWERKSVDKTPIEHYPYGVVLSGMVEYNAERGDFNFLRSSDRIWQAVKLCHQGVIDTIVITGGAANLFAPDTTEAVLLRNFIIETGVDSLRIVIETQSRNTYENAIFTQQQIGVRHPILLITSASHMPRAAKCFIKAGFNVQMYPVDRYAMPRRYNIDNLIIPQSSVIFNWNALFHEFFGLTTYQMMGYI